jgi:hypothetical protein
MKKINKCMNTCIVKYREGVSARRTLNLLEDAPKEHPREDKRVKPDSKGEPKGEPEAEAKPQPPQPPANPAADKPKDESWKASKTCFLCGKVGHIRPECPDGKKLGLNTIKLSGGSHGGPHLAVALGCPSDGWV